MRLWTWFRSSPRLLATRDEEKWLEKNDFYIFEKNGRMIAIWMHGWRAEKNKEESRFKISTATSSNVESESILV